MSLTAFEVGDFIYRDEYLEPSSAGLHWYNEPFEEIRHAD
jgi:hypothetical protein